MVDFDAIARACCPHQADSNVALSTERNQPAVRNAEDIPPPRVRVVGLSRSSRCRFASLLRLILVRKTNTQDGHRRAHLCTSSDRHALEEMDKTTARMERMFRRLHMRLDAVNPGDVSFS